MDCSPPGFSVPGIFQARVLEWGAIAFSRLSLKESFLFCFVFFRKKKENRKKNKQKEDNNDKKFEQKNVNSEISREQKFKNKNSSMN